MPFGLRNAGMTFQRMMDQIFFDLPCVFVYLDDLLIASRSAAEHRVHLRQVLQLLQTNGLVINLDKCIFGQPRLEFLGHVVHADGISPLQDRVKAVKEFPKPTTVVEMQAFLGLYNYYRRFVPAAARLLKPLTDALQGGLKPSSKLEWTSAMDAAFSAAKSALSAATLLDHPSPAAELMLVTDASGTHVGAVLQQRRGQQAWRALGFFSQKLSDTETRYSAFDRELLAVYSGILHFRHLLEGRHFVVRSDHKPLAGALTRVSDPRSDRQRRQLAFIAEFVSEIQHIAGADNVVADALSRPPPPAVAAAAVASSPSPSSPSSSPPSTSSPSASTPSPSSSSGAASSGPPSPVDLSLLAAAQRSCPDCARAVTSTALRVVKVEVEGHKLWVDTSSGVLRPLVPAELRRRIFAAVHSLAHPGIRASRRLIASRYLWPGLAKDVAAWCRDCTACQAAKVTRQPAAAAEQILTPTQRFSHVHVDLVGPLPTTSDGYSYLLTAADRSTRWFEAFPLRGTSAAVCAEQFISGWVARFGVPALLTSDRGVQFTSALWGAVMKKLGIKHKMSTAFHPQSNGLVERAHRRLKDALKARLAGSEWSSHLPWVLLGLRAAPREDSGVSAAELVYGAPLTLPGPLLTAAEPPPEFFLQHLQSTVPCVATRPVSDKTDPDDLEALMTATHVYVRSPPAAPSLTPAYRGPFLVHKRAGKYFILRVGSRFDAITVDRLKPHRGSSPPVVASPPRRGRPINIH
jgi:transposase InsO family protein